MQENTLGDWSVKEMIFLVGAICFIFGGCLGVGFMCLFKAAGQADRDPERDENVQHEV
jgi:hypothetical protein